jgi:3-dehydroquinate dehydratase-1
LLKPIETEGIEMTVTKSMTKPIEIKGRVIAEGKLPLVCTPLVGGNREAILSEATAIISKKQDILEWRVDFFDHIADASAVIETARQIREMAGKTPILLTRRSVNEGGQPINMSEDEVVKMYSAVCQSGSVELIDFEMSNAPEHVRHLRTVSRENDIKMIMSYHNFQETPALDVLSRRFQQAESQGADIAKVAVMPTSLEDVMTLLAATLQSAQKVNIPLISMSMGGYGSLTRMFGWVFGSAMTFAVGESSSAPGQVPIEDLNTVISIVRKSIYGG